MFLFVVFLGWCFAWFLIYFWSIFGSEIDQQSIKNLSKNQSKTTCKLGWILDRSWIDFWSILGPSWGPSWGQVGTKIRKNGVPNRCRKIIKKQVMQGAAGKMRKFLAVPNRIPPGSSKLEYKSTRGNDKLTRNTPLSGSRPGGGFLLLLLLLSL